MEIWKDIPGYENKYQVSDLGRVKTLKRLVNYGRHKAFRNERILKPLLRKDNYYQVLLSKDRVKKTYCIHQLMAITFLDYNLSGFEKVVDHINNIRTDNNLKNLRIVTARENTSKHTKRTTSKYTGVSWCNREKRWMPKIQIGKKQKYLGRFKDEYKAHLAYQKALKEIQK